MTENKRFEIDLDKEAITDNGEYCISLYCFQDKGEKGVVELLNELHDENKTLKEQLGEQGTQLDFLKDENQHMRTVINENMQLKKLLRKISNCNGEIWLSNGRIIRLKKIFNGEWIND